MCVDVARPKHFREQLTDGTFRPACAVIDHHGNVCEIAGDDRLLIRLPLGPVEMRALDTDDDVFVLQGEVAGRLAVHVAEVLFELSATKAVAHDVDEAEHSGSGMSD